MFYFYFFLHSSYRDTLSITMTCVPSHNNTDVGWHGRRQLI